MFQPTSVHSFNPADYFQNGERCSLTHSVSRKVDRERADSNASRVYREKVKSRVFHYWFGDITFRDSRHSMPRSCLKLELASPPSSRRSIKRRATSLRKLSHVSFALKKLYHVPCNYTMYMLRYNLIRSEIFRRDLTVMERTGFLWISLSCYFCTLFSCYFSPVLKLSKLLMYHPL